MVVKYKKCELVGNTVADVVDAFVTKLRLDKRLCYSGQNGLGGVVLTQEDVARFAVRGVYRYCQELRYTSK